MRNNKNFSTIYQTEGGGNINTIGNITVDELHEYVSLMASKIAKITVEENSVITGTIIASAGNNYTIQLKTSDSQSSARPLTDGAVYNIGDYVYLIRGAAAIEGGESPSYFIFGRVDDANEAFANASDLERFNGQDLYTLTLPSVTFQRGSDENEPIFWTRLKNYKALKVEGNFTSMAGVEVGVTVTYNYADGTEEKFKLDSAWMQGQPNNMNSLYQARIIERTKKLTDKDSVTVTVVGGTNVILTVGTLNKYLKDFSLEVKPTNKSYFRNELPEKLEEDTVCLEAKLKYLDSGISSGVQYYWFVEMPEAVNLADADKDQVNDIIDGDRWYCLNSYNDCNVVGQEGTIRIWDKSDNFIVLDKFKYLHKIDGQDIFCFDSLNQIPLKFINKIKCVAVYEGFYINSEVFELVDYSKESFTIEISANQPDLSLITEDSEIILTCKVKQDNEMIGKDKFSYSYLWVIDGKTEFKVKKGTADSYTEEEVQYTQPTLKLKDTITNIYADNTYDLTDEKVTVKCRVGIDGSDADTVSDYSEDSNELTITSFVFSESTINEYIFYKYLISGINETFTSKLENGYLDWTSTSGSSSWVSDDEDELADWTGETSNWPLTGKTGAAARDYLNTIVLDNNEYLYYTTKSVWIEEKLDTQLASDQKYIKIKEGDWSLPRMLRGVTENGNNLSEGAVNKINAFNDLTNGGKKQGFYLKDVYYPTEDKSPQEGKTYYLLSAGEYVKQESLGEEFVEGKIYYECEPRLFINAEFIQTGALKVADENGNSIFYADIDQKKVEIGGFTVNNHSINNSNNVKDDTKQIYIGQDYVKFGSNFNYEVDTGKLDITGIGADYLIIKNDDEPKSTVFYASNDDSKRPNDVPDGVKVYAQDLASISSSMGTLTAGEIIGEGNKWTISTQEDKPFISFINGLFSLSHEGELLASQGQIGHITIENQQLASYGDTEQTQLRYVLDRDGLIGYSSLQITTGKDSASPGLFFAYDSGTDINNYSGSTVELGRCYGMDWRLDQTKEGNISLYRPVTLTLQQQLQGSYSDYYIRIVGSVDVQPKFQHILYGSTISGTTVTCTFDSQFWLSSATFSSNKKILTWDSWFGLSLTSIAEIVIPGYYELTDCLLENNQIKMYLSKIGTSEGEIEITPTNFSFQTNSFSPNIFCQGHLLPKDKIEYGETTKGYLGNANYPWASITSWDYKLAQAGESKEVSLRTYLLKLINAEFKRLELTNADGWNTKEIGTYDSARRINVTMINEGGKDGIDTRWYIAMTQNGNQRTYILHYYREGIVISANKPTKMYADCYII